MSNESNEMLKCASNSILVSAVPKEFERLYDKLNYQNSNLKENVNELYSLSNRLKMRSPIPSNCDPTATERSVPDSDIVGSLWSESYRIEDLNTELREIINHLNSVI